MDLEIREAGEADAAAIVRIWNQIIQTGAYSALDTPLTVDKQRAFMGCLPERGFIHLAEALPNREVVGFQTVEPFATYTHAFDHVGVIGTCVDLALRQRGIGSCLACASFEKARREGYEKMFTYVRADNQAALGFYLALGFRVIGSAQNQAKFGGTYVDEVFIEKFL